MRVVEIEFEKLITYIDKLLKALVEKGVPIDKIVIGDVDMRKELDSRVMGYLIYRGYMVFTENPTVFRISYEYYNYIKEAEGVK